MPAAGSGDFVVKAVLDVNEYMAGLETIKKGSQKAMAALRKIGNRITSMGSMVSQAIVFGFGASAFEAARNAEAAARKFEAVFAETSKDVMKWAQEIGTTFAVTTDDMQRFLAMSQDLFVPMGLAREEAAELSKQVVELASKLAIFNGQPTAQVLQNIQSGLVGITRSVRQYGILLNETNTAQEAVRLGLAATTKEVTEQAKVQARLSLMMTQSADAWNNAANMVNGAVGAHARIAKALKEVREELGRALVPIVEEFSEWLQDVTPRVVQWVKVNQPLIETLGRIAVKLAEVTIALKAFSTASALAGTAKGIADIFGGVGAGAVTGAGIGIAASPVAIAAGGAYIYHDQTQALAASAQQIIEDADRAIEVINKKRFKEWSEQAQQMVTGSLAEMLQAILQVDIEQGAQKAKVFSRVLVDAIKTAGPEARSELKALYNQLGQVGSQHAPSLLKPIESALTAQFSTMDTKYKELMDKRNKETKKAIERDMQNEQKYFDWRINQIKKAIQDEMNERKKALDAIAAARQSKVDRALAEEERMFEAERRLLQAGEVQSEQDRRKAEREREARRQAPETLSPTQQAAEEAFLDAERRRRAQQEQERGAETPEEYRDRIVAEFRGEKPKKRYEYDRPAESERELIERRALRLEELARVFSEQRGDFEQAAQLAEQAKRLWMEYFELGPKEGETMRQSLDNVNKEIKRINDLMDTWDNAKIKEAKNEFAEAGANLKTLSEAAELAFKNVNDLARTIQNMAASKPEIKLDASKAIDQVTQLERKLRSVKDLAQSIGTAGGLGGLSRSTAATAYAEGKRQEQAGELVE